MIKIQKLKEPKKTSGTKLLPGKLFKVAGVEIKNKNTFPIYVDTFKRKKPKKVKSSILDDL